jgi:hypothetical protein
MKKISKALFSVFFATAVAFPATAMADSTQELDNTAEEGAIQACEDDHYNRAFLTGDFGLQFSRTSLSDQSGSLIMFLSGPDGKIVKDAQVVTTIIEPFGAQQMQRARPLKGGYLVDTAHLAPGQYRLEAEIITHGWLLTDEFHFQKV